MTSRHITTILLVGCLIPWSGCRQEVKQRKYRAVTGVASAIDLETGEVSMDWENSKTGEVKRLTGRITQATEIMINGVTAHLDAVRVGDRAVVVVYRSPDGGQGWIVTSVSIERQGGFILDRSRARNAVSPDGSSTDQ